MGCTVGVSARNRANDATRDARARDSSSPS